MTPLGERDLFTRYVLGFAGCDDSTTAQVLSELRRLFKLELRKRGLTELPPAYLGCAGEQRWTENSIEEFVFELHDHVFVEGMDALSSKLEEEGCKSIAGMVNTRVRWFIHDRQRRADPTGAGVYRNLRLVLAEAVAEGWLVSSASPGKGPGGHERMSFTGTAPDELPASLAELEGALEVQNDLRQKAATLASDSQRARAALTGCLQTLAAAGLRGFLVHDLKTALTALVRRARSTRRRSEQAGARRKTDLLGERTPSPLLGPAETVCEALARDEFAEKMLQAIRSSSYQARVRVVLEQLFREVDARLRDGLPAPTQAELSERFDLPTSSMGDHWERLRVLADKLNRS